MAGQFDSDFPALGANNTADYVYFLLLGTATMLTVSECAGCVAVLQVGMAVGVTVPIRLSLASRCDPARAYFVAVPFLSFSLSFMIVYVYCMKHRSALRAVTSTLL